MSLVDRAFAALQYLLPQHLLSRGMHALTRSRVRWLKNLLIRGFLLIYEIDRDEMREPDPLAFATFNDFFTRALKPDARAIASSPAVVASPVDGGVSQCGRLAGDRLLQAKGRTYSAHELLGGQGMVGQYADGEFVCLYLAPYNYHRIHMPADGRLLRTVYVPGDLFSVNASTARTVPDLFARNERVVCEFATAFGHLAVVMIGALFVGSIETVWAGEVNPPPHRRRRAPSVLGKGTGREFVKGEEIGRFNMGSTVILLGECGRLSWRDSLAAGTAVRYGEAIATIVPAHAHAHA